MPLRAAAVLAYARPVTERNDPSEPSVSAVAAHYDDFSYPTVSVLPKPLPARFERHLLNALLGRREDGLAADAKIWVAGCGTQQGAHFGMCFPEAQILATDVSDRTLELAAGVADQLGVDNVRFERRDLMTESFPERFDFIACTGVVHHLPAPAVGLANLRRSLSSNGALLLMVYSAMHRGGVDAMRQAIDLLGRDGESADQRYALSGRVLERTLASPRCRPLSSDALAQLLDNHERDRGFVADVLLHPLEVSYDVDGLAALLESADLRHTAWYHPREWELSHYVDDAALQGRFDALDEVAQWKVVYYLAGRAGPQIKLLAEPRGAPVRAPLTLDDLMDRPLLCRDGSEVARVEVGRVTARGHVDAYSFEDDRLGGYERGDPNARHNWTAAAAIEPILVACDGRATLRELLERFSGDFQRDELLAIFRRFLPFDLGLVVPCW